MIGSTRTPDVEWYDLFDCSTCHRRTLLHGVMRRRYVNLLVVRIPLGRSWHFRCQFCNATRKVDEESWRERRQQGVSPQEAYLEREKMRFLARRSES